MQSTIQLCSISIHSQLQQLTPVAFSASVVDDIANKPHMSEKCLMKME